MPCENYREALIEAAAGGGVPSDEVRAHVKACAACQTAFSEELQLFSAIDTGLRVSANAEVPASLLPRVRVQLNEQVVQGRSWAPVGAAVAAAVVLVVVVIFIRGLGSGPHGVDPNVNSLAHGVPHAVIQAASPNIAPVGRASTTAKHESFPPARKGRAAQTEELTVLIPAGQKQAIYALLASVREGKAKTSILPTGEAEDSLKEPAFTPLVILPIELKPLVEVSTESLSEGGKTRR